MVAIVFFRSEAFLRNKLCCRPDQTSNFVPSKSAFITTLMGYSSIRCSKIWDRGNTAFIASRAVLNSWYPPSQLRHYFRGISWEKNNNNKNISNSKQKPYILSTHLLFLPHTNAKTRKTLTYTTVKVASVIFAFFLFLKNLQKMCGRSFRCFTGKKTSGRNRRGRLVPVGYFHTLGGSGTAGREVVLLVTSHSSSTLTYPHMYVRYISPILKNLLFYVTVST